MTLFTNLKIRSGRVLNRAVNYARVTHLNASDRRRCCKINYKALSAESAAQSRRACACNSPNVRASIFLPCRLVSRYRTHYKQLSSFAGQPDLYYLDKLFLPLKSQTKHNSRGRLLLDSRPFNWTLPLIFGRSISSPPIVKVDSQILFSNPRGTPRLVLHHDFISTAWTSLDEEIKCTCNFFFVRRELKMKGKNRRLPLN